ncbi:FadR/GntR family transcriptional regulator [Butyricicoccus sp.]|uniref:FadR/GntR family transcriptional regulator n=1 Tax=Butyricicoccus sp. TaxID=2049021 RepID=UPI003F18D360
MVEKKAYKVVFDYFKNKILSGEIGIGYKLPAERDIAEQLGVSRNSVREAIRMLEMMGFVESLQGSGNYICCDPHGYFTQSFNMLMVLRDISYNEIFDTRRAMEFEALTLAVQNITQEELERLHDVLQQMDEPMSLKSNAKLDVEFHRILIQASHNTLMIYLTQLMSDLLDIFIKNLRTSILADRRRAKALRASHWDIYNALLTHDAARAYEAMEQHFEIVKEHVIKFEQKHPDFSDQEPDYPDYII